MIRLKLVLSICLVVGVMILGLFAGQEPYPIVTAVKDGVKTVSNPDYPRDGRFVAKLTQEMSCGEEGGPPEGVLNKPFRLEVDGQGNVYVMDSRDVNIKVYDDQGRFVRAIGRQGQGPSEFGDMVFFGLMSGNRICVLDVMQSRVIILATDGRFISGFPLNGFFASMAVDGRDRIFLGKRAAVKEPDKLSTEFRKIPFVTSVFRTDVSGNEIVHLTDMLGESLLMKASGGIEVSLSRRVDTIVWTVSPDGRLIGGYTRDYSLGVYGEDGKKELALGREYSPAKSSLILDEAGNLWVELLQAAGAKGALYDVYSPEGLYLKQVSVEQRISAFKHGKIYCLVLPEGGYPSIKRYKMELWPSSK